MTPTDDDRVSSHPSPARARGFAAMGPERRREIARAGGRAAHEKGTAHEFNSTEGRAAGLKSGSNRLTRMLAGLGD